MSKQVLLIIGVIVLMLAGISLVVFRDKLQPQQEIVQVQEPEISPDVAPTSIAEMQAKKKPEIIIKDLPEARAYLEVLTNLQQGQEGTKFSEVYFAVQTLIHKLQLTDQDRIGGEDTVPGVLLGAQEKQEDWVDKTQMDLQFFSQIARDKGTKEDQLLMDYLNAKEKSKWLQDSKVAMEDIFYIQCLNSAPEGLPAYYKNLTTKLDQLKDSPYDLQEDVDYVFVKMDKEDLCFCRAKNTVKKDLTAFGKNVKDNDMKTRLQNILKKIDNFSFDGECAIQPAKEGAL